MNDSLRRLWRWVRWPLTLLALGFIVLVAWRLKLLYEQDDTNAAVAAIHANRLTQEDVFGDLPPEPNEAENNATLAGIDSNNNGIRDDVERAIYFKYQESAKAAAPAFQYAKALQMEFTRVYNSETLVAVIQEEGRGYSCVYGREEEVENLVFNTEMRKKFREDIREKFMTSYKSLNEEDCDIIL
ncbi:MAG: hypothetical protein JWL87_281 [Candidatus Adlerbacteria bacterium]|nr:hypothetical protein [Candidatus Adlerbacteria bacterium]